MRFSWVGFHRRSPNRPCPASYSARGVPPPFAFFVRLHLSVITRTIIGSALRFQTLLSESPPPLPTRCHPGHWQSEVPTLATRYYGPPRRRPPDRAIAYAYPGCPGFSAARFQSRSPTRLDLSTDYRLAPQQGANGLMVLQTAPSKGAVTRLSYPASPGFPESQRHKASP